MYRIEVRPGEETVFRTIEELATAIRNGLVTSRARIFHNASQKWLPIEFHPHYKKALTLPRTPSGETPAVGVPSLSPIFTPKPSPAPVFTPTPAAPEPPRTATAHEPFRSASARRPFRSAAAEEFFRSAEAGDAARSAATDELSYPAAPDELSRTATADERSRSAPAPDPVASPVGVLPRIAHDAPILLAEDPYPALPMPVAHPPTARRSASRFRPIHLGAAAAVLVAGSYVALSAAAPADDASPAPAPAASEGPDRAAEQPKAAASVALVQRDDSTTAAVPAAPVPRPIPVSAGTSPTFGPPAVAPAARVAPVAPKPAIVTSSGATSASPEAADTTQAIEPPPSEVDISVPALPSGDSLAPAVQSDSGAIRRILRAVGGKAPSTTRP